MPHPGLKIKDFQHSRLSPFFSTWEVDYMEWEYWENELKDSL